LELTDGATEKGIPALIITGYAFDVHNDAPGVDMSQYTILLKPLRPHELLTAVAAALGT